MVRPRRRTPGVGCASSTPYGIHDSTDFTQPYAAAGLARVAHDPPVALGRKGERERDSRQLLVTSPASCLTSPGSAFFEGHLEDADLYGLLGHDAGHVLDRLLLLPHLGRVGRRHQVQLVPPVLEESGLADVHLLADIGRLRPPLFCWTAPYLGLHRVVRMSHLVGVLVLLGWVVDTP